MIDNAEEDGEEYSCGKLRKIVNQKFNLNIKSNTTIHQILRNKIGFTFKGYYRKNIKKNNPNAINSRAFFAHELFCNYIPNDKFIIAYDETGIN